MEFNATVTKITDHSVTYEKDGQLIEIDNDYVFAMIGYHPDYDFLKTIGIDIHTNEYGTAPVYIAGVIAAGNDANTIFIENGKYHGGVITQSILTKKQTPLET